MSIPDQIKRGPAGYDGIEEVPSSIPGAFTCQHPSCGKSWLEDRTPAGRCPWEHEHEDIESVFEERDAVRRDIEAAVSEYRLVFPEPYALPPNLDLAVRALAVMTEEGL